MTIGKSEGRERNLVRLTVQYESKAIPGKLIHVENEWWKGKLARRRVYGRKKWENRRDGYTGVEVRASEW
jgi:hypothetical protein